jgi:hypothetical protein
MGLKNKLIIKLEEYIELLGDECSDLVGVVYYRGWRSKRVEQGEKLRNEIKELKNEIERTERKVK